jgi:hypothetical protein
MQQKLFESYQGGYRVVALEMFFEKVNILRFLCTKKIENVLKKVSLRFHFGTKILTAISNNVLAIIMTTL